MALSMVRAHLSQIQPRPSKPRYSFSSFPSRFMLMFLPSEFKMSTVGLLDRANVLRQFLYESRLSDIFKPATVVAVHIHTNCDIAQKNKFHFLRWSAVPISCKQGRHIKSTPREFGLSLFIEKISDSEHRPRVQSSCPCLEVDGS